MHGVGVSIAEDQASVEDLGDGRFKVTITLDVVTSGGAFLEKLKETFPSAEFDEQPTMITVIVAPPPPPTPPPPPSPPPPSPPPTPPPLPMICENACDRNECLSPAFLQIFGFCILTQGSDLVNDGRCDDGGQALNPTATTVVLAPIKKWMDGF